MLRRRVASLAVIAVLQAASIATFARPASAQPQPTQPAQPSPPRPDLVARGKQLFDDQQYEESMQALSAALLRPNNTREQKVEIYRLLALNYITLNRKDEAGSAY